MASRFLWRDITIAERFEASVLGVRTKLPWVRMPWVRMLRYQLVDMQGLLRCVSIGTLAGVRILELNWVTATSLSIIFSHCPRLIALDAPLGPWGDRETLDQTRVLREGFSKLKSLKLKLLHAASAERLLQLAAESGGLNLESITLVNLYCFDYDRLLTRIGRRCLNLRDVSAQSPNWIRLMIPLLPTWGKLVRLQCQFYVSHKLLEQIVTLCINLKYLEVSANSHSLRILAKGPFLCEINFSSLSDVCADDFAYWLQRRGESLIVFNASYCICLTDELLEILARYAPNLKAAGVGFVESSRGALAILRGCRKLETLHFRGDFYNYKDRTIYHTAASQGVALTETRPLPLTSYVDLMKEKWIGL
ncbi:hypothetical protein HK104_004014 [Borealophlyctis nickersoniae]|nr:hypothetical protein HK104_004014 [Borealophlyctis nickersoniae]